MKKANQPTIDRTIIERYTDQPARMPVEVRRAIEGAWGGSVREWAVRTTCHYVA